MTGAEGAPGDLRNDQLARYARQLILDQVGAAGQARLLGARVLIAGAGGLGSPALTFLAAAGIGHVTLVDDDQVRPENLQRQFIHAGAPPGTAKVESAHAFIAALNPDCHLAPGPLRLAADNADGLLTGVQLALDCTDNGASRALLSDACQRAGVPLVMGAVAGFDGQVAVFLPGGPCWRCLHPVPPDDGGCAGLGVMGAAAGVIGALMAMEALKLLLDMGEALAGRLLLYEGLTAETRILAIDRRPGCLGCALSNFTNS